MKIYLAATALAATLSFSLIVGPSHAAFSALRCDGTIDMESEATKEFAERLRISSQHGASVVAWGGCFKVQYLDADGKYVTEYYDMDTRQRVDAD